MPFRWQDFGAENLTRGDDTTDGMAAHSGIVTNNQSSTLSITVTGPGTLTFWWACIADNTAFDYEVITNGDPVNGYIRLELNAILLCLISDAHQRCAEYASGVAKLMFDDGRFHIIGEHIFADGSDALSVNGRKI